MKVLVIGGPAHGMKKSLMRGKATLTLPFAVGDKIVEHVYVAAMFGGHEVYMHAESLAGIEGDAMQRGKNSERRSAGMAHQEFLAKLAIAAGQKWAVDSGGDGKEEFLLERVAELHKAVSDATSISDAPEGRPMTASSMGEAEQRLRDTDFREMRQQGWPARLYSRIELLEQKVEQLMAARDNAD